MKYAADFRAIARNSLKGRWTLAVLVSLVAALLGGSSAGSPIADISFNNFNNPGAQGGGEHLLTGGSFMHPELALFLATFAIYFLAAILIFAALSLFLGSVVSIGYARFNLSLVDREQTGFEQLFGYFSWWKTAVFSRLLRFLYVFLWSLLFIIPGIVAAYGYAMTDFILAEHPEMPASQAIAISKEMMRGNKFRLFCLELSFIGWEILCALTLGIGYLWLAPYRSAAYAAFFREISGTERHFPADAPTWS